ncbi:hypothetical protein PRIC2_004567 [Phytophthora ramorum]
MASSAPRRHGLLHLLLLGSLLYALAVLSYSLFSVHSTSLLPSVRLSGVFESVQTTFGHVRRTAEQQQADNHAFQVGLLPSGETMERHFKCIGWRATGGCRPSGPRLPALDRPCTKTIPHGQSGYCELQDEDSGELFRVARRTCADVVGKAALFRCLEAPRFANFHALAREAAQRALDPGFALPNAGSSDHVPKDGIVMVVYPKMVPSAYATIRVLREVLRCRLPIEIWFRPDEMRKVTASIDPLHQIAANDSIGGISFREIDDPLAVEFATKVFAVYNSAFARVLFLDSDNVPVRDPTFLFQTPEFVTTGGRSRNPADQKLKAIRENEAPVDNGPDGLPDAAIWTHLLSFRSSSPRSKYQIETYHAEPEFSKDQVCYGQRRLGENDNFYAQEFAVLSFSGLETHLRRFAMEAGQLHQAKVDAIAEAQQLQRKPFRLQGEETPDDHGG